MEIPDKVLISKIDCLAVIGVTPEERALKQRLYIVHIARKDVPPDAGLKTAEVGLDSTLRIEVERPQYAEEIEILNVFCSIDFFRGCRIAGAESQCAAAGGCAERFVHSGCALEVGAALEAEC